MAKKDKKKEDRAFDFTQYPTRNICLKVAYHGQDYDGLAKQDHTANTIETLLVDALKRVRLINPVPPGTEAEQETTTISKEGDAPPVSSSSTSTASRIHKVKAEAAERYIAAARANGHTHITNASSLTESMHLQPEQFSRCGRTDRGVSALGNAFSCRMRVSKDGEPPLDYCKMLNMALPNTIRVVGWSYVGDGFDARFSCIQRTYRYFMHLGGLDLKRMEEALSYLVGSHDFRNFCKMDVVNVGSFVREIASAKIVPLCTVKFHREDESSHVGTSGGGGGAEADSDVPIGYLEIVGNAFLYHQIRCTVCILVLIGKGLEEPSLVKHLLDVEKYPSKPCYPLADDSPLVLWDCEFSSDSTTRTRGEGGEPIKWNHSDESRWVVERELRDIATSMLIRTATAMSMHQQIIDWATLYEQRESNSKENASLERLPVTGVDWTNGRAPVGAIKRQLMAGSWEEAFIGGSKTGGYRPILSRPTEKTYDQRVGALSGQKRLRHETNLAKREADQDE